MKGTVFGEIPKHRGLGHFTLSAVFPESCLNDGTFLNLLLLLIEQTNTVEPEQQLYSNLSCDLQRDFDVCLLPK